MNPTDDQQDPLRPASLGAQVLLLTQEFGQFKTNFAQFQTEIRDWMHQRQSSWRGVWPIAVTIGGILWFVLNLQITTATKSVDDKANQALILMQALNATVAKNAESVPTLQQQAADSKRDREDKGILIAKLAETQVELAKVLAALSSETRAGFTEVETQIDAMSQSINMALAEVFRQQTNHQNALHDMGAKVPSAPTGPFVFPNISNRNHRKQP